jgi:mRNA-degrading endonuclease RelE of RelBE toxin-antitoxin system
VDFQYTDRFRRSYQAAPPEIRKTFAQKAKLLLNDLRHPSLRAKKYSEAEQIWQARVNRDWRFYFLIEDSTYILLDIMAHPK